MAIIDLTFLKDYIGKWVAITKDETKVVGSGNTLKEAKLEAEKKGYKKPIFHKVLPLDKRYIPTTL